MRKTKRKIKVDATTIPRDQSVHTVLHAVRKLSSKEIAEKTGLARSTVDKIRVDIKDGGTRWPRHHTLVLIGGCVNLQCSWSVPAQAATRRKPAGVDITQHMH